MGIWTARPPTFSVEPGSSPPHDVPRRRRGDRSISMMEAVNGFRCMRLPCPTRLPTAAEPSLRDPRQPEREPHPLTPWSPQDSLQGFFPGFRLLRLTSPGFSRPGTPDSFLGSSPPKSALRAWTRRDPASTHHDFPTPARPRWRARRPSRPSPRPRPKPRPPPQVEPPKPLVCRCKSATGPWSP